MAASISSRCSSAPMRPRIGARITTAATMTGPPRPSAERARAGRMSDDPHVARAEQSGGPAQQHRREAPKHDERRPVDAEVAAAEGLAQPDDDPAEGRAGEAAEAADGGGREH